MKPTRLPPLSATIPTSKPYDGLPLKIPKSASFKISASIFPYEAHLDRPDNWIETKAGQESLTRQSYKHSAN